MSLYKIFVSKSAAKELSKLPAETNNRIIKVILELRADPRPHGSVKLKGSSENWRIRIGDYRVISP